MGIYQSVRRAKLASKGMTVPIWKIWDHEGTDRQVTKVDKRRLQQNKKKRYKPTSITNKWKVTYSIRLASCVSEPVNRTKYVQATFDDLADVVMEKNGALTAMLSMTN